MPRFPMTICPTGSYLKSDTWQLQLRFVVPISKSRSLILIKNFACYSSYIGVANNGRCLILNEARG